MIERPAAAPASVEQLVQPNTSDISALIGLMRQEDPVHQMRPSSEFEAEIEEYTHREKTALFVARAAINSYNDENGEVTGYVRTREKPTDNPNTLHIEGIFMRQDGSSHSSGRELVRFVLKHAEARGLTAVQVDTYPKSVPMHQLLKSMDFKKVTIGERELYTQQLKKT